MSSADYRYIRSFFTAGQIRRGLGITILASALGSVFYTQAVPVSILFAAFALQLRVSNPAMSILVATLPMASVFEVVMAYLIQRTGRRQEFFTWGLVGSRLLWLPIILIPFYIPAADHALRMVLLCALLFLSSVVSAAGNNAWGTWMGDLVPGTVLGRYFGLRQVFTVLSASAAGVLLGKYLDYYRAGRGAPGDEDFGAFLVVISVLLVFGVMDIVVFRWVPHPPMRRREERHTLWDMVRIPLGDARYRSVILLFGLWNFTANIVGPYVGIFLLGANYAGMSNARSNLYGAIGGLSLVVTSYYWGRLADRWKPRKVLALCLCLASVPPLFYLIATPRDTWPIVLAMILGNVGWGGVFVVTMQFIIGMAPSKDRSMYLACQSAIMGIVLTASYLVGGVVVKLLAGVEWHVGPYVWRDLHVLFLICSVARFACLIPLKSLPEKQSG